MTKQLLITYYTGTGKTQWMAQTIADGAREQGISVKVLPVEDCGMAQRGGVVESALVFGDASSTIISDGEADVLVGFEPAETLRALSKCNADTVVITNLRR